MTTDDAEARRHGGKEQRGKLSYGTELSERVIAAAIEVHRHFGPGFLEVTYQRALAVELELSGIRFEREVPVSLEYRGRSVGDGRIDFLVAGELVVELKAVPTQPKVFHRQVVAYLKATGQEVGLVINFAFPKLVDGVTRVVA